MSRGARRLLGMCGLAPTVAVVFLCLRPSAVVTDLDRTVYDALLRATPLHAPTGHVVIVDVDERSLSTIGQWPWRRDRIGDLIGRLRALGAATVALDIIFAEPDREPGPGGRSDAELARVLRGGHVVLGYALTFDDDARPARCLEHPLRLALVEPAADAGERPFFRATKAICNLEGFARAASTSGFLNAAPDSDGILRRVPLLVEFGDHVYPSLALAAVSHFTDAQATALRVANVNAASLVLGTTTPQNRSRHPAEERPLAGEVQVDGKSHLLLRYRGGKRTFPYISATDVLNGTVAADAVAGKIVFVGTTALGTREVVATPLDTLFTGVEVQATVADNLLQRDFLYRPEHAAVVEALTALLAGLTLAAVSRRWGLRWGTATLAMLAAIVWGGALSLLAENGLYVSPLMPTLALAGGLAAMTAVAVTIEHRRADRAGRADAASRRLMVHTLLSLVATRDAETGRHSSRTQGYTRVLTEALAAHPDFAAYLTPDRIELLSTLAPLHDIGKVGVPDRILNKQGLLSHAEMAEMQKHPVYGRDVILNAQKAAGVQDDETLMVAKDLVYTHHERWDGTGYPNGLRGAEIPIPGRILAVVDVYDALTTSRPYHAARTHDAAKAIIIRGSGTHFDPAVVAAFLNVSQQFRELAAGTTRSRQAS